MSWFRRCLLLLATFSLAALVCRPLAAQQEPDESDGDRAVELGNEGVTLYERADWAAAFDRFRRAEALYHSPVFVVYMARCQREQGRLLEARALYRMVADEELGPEAFQPWVRARAEANDELRALADEIPGVVVTLHGASPSAQLTLDDMAIEPGERVEANPGDYVVEARDGTARVSKRVTLAAGGADVRLELEFEAPEASQRDSSPSGPPLELVETSPNTTGWVLTLAGGATLFAGSVVGIHAARVREQNERKLPESCQGTTCLDSERAGIERRNDRAKRVGLTADLVLVGGAALTLTGVAILTFYPDHETRVDGGVTPREVFVRVTF